MNKSPDCEIAVLGGGAAGMTAAIAAARALRSRRRGRGRVVLLEHGPRVGKKLLSTGNGRCNLTNLQATPSHYHGADASFIRPALDCFPPDAVIRFFQSLGLLCRTEEDGRVYPYSGQASAVLDLLRIELDRLQVEQLFDCSVRHIRKQKGSFLVEGGSTPLTASRLIAATGGKSAPSTGSDGSGFSLMQELGHTVVKPFPALTQIKTDAALMRSLKGLRCEGEVSFLADGTVIRREAGEIQFAENGLSGICVFQLSRLAGEFFTFHTVNGKPASEIALSLDLMPEHTSKEVFDLLCLLKEEHPALPLENVLTGLLNKRLGQALLKAAGCSPLSRTAATLENRELSRISALLKKWCFAPAGLSSWSSAQVTAGGLSCGEFDPLTMQSWKASGLYAAGELLDVDGDCGGFNLQWAWSSGLLAGQSAADSLLHTRPSAHEKETK